MHSQVPVLACVFALMLPSCSRDDDKVPVPGRPGAAKTSAVVRAERRLFDGAPPVIPHRSMGADCLSCHSGEGTQVDGLGFAPPNPHAESAGGDMRRCRQCHVFAQTAGVFRASSFEGIRQDLRKGSRLHEFAPPVMPHPLLLRENCSACHTGPAAREEIRCPHPERVRCQQCHVAQETEATFHR